jgi:hypothetical protein
MVPLLVALYATREHTGMGILLPFQSREGCELYMENMQRLRILTRQLAVCGSARVKKYDTNNKYDKNKHKKIIKWSHNTTYSIIVRSHK